MKLGPLLLLLSTATLCLGDNGPVWLSVPTLVASGQSLRIDIQTWAGMHHARVTRVIACSATDKPFRSFQPTSPETTGCNSHGFERQEIYSVESSAQMGSLASKFRVRQSAQSLYIRRRLVEKHSPVVYLEIHIYLQDPLSKIVPVDPIGITADPNDWVLTTRYECTERALPLGVEVYETGKDEKQGALSAAMAAFGPAHEDDSDKLNDLSYDASVDQKGMHWSSYAAIVAGFIIVMLGVIAIAIVNKDRRVKQKMRTYEAFGMTTAIPDNEDTKNNYAASKSAADRNILVKWINAGANRGVYSNKMTTEQRALVGED